MMQSHDMESTLYEKPPVKDVKEELKDVHYPMPDKGRVLTNDRYARASDLPPLESSKIIEIDGEVYVVPEKA